MNKEQAISRARHGQRRTHSALESITSTSVGFILSYLAGFAIFPLFGWHVSPAQNLGIVLCYTVISLLRQYVLRRVFNAWHVRSAQ